MRQLQTNDMDGFAVNDDIAGVDLLIPRPFLGFLELGIESFQTALLRKTRDYSHSRRSIISRHLYLMGFERKVACRDILHRRRREAILREQVEMPREDPLQPRLSSSIR